MYNPQRYVLNKLASDSLTVGFWQVVRLVSSYLLMFVLAHFTSVEDVGRYANFLALTSVAVPLFLLKPEAMVARARFFNDEPAFVTYAGSVLGYCIVGCLACGSLLLILGPLASETTGIDTVWLLLLVPYLLGYASLYVTSTMAQLDGAMSRSAVTRGLEGAFRLALGVILVILLEAGWKGALWSVIGGIVFAAAMSWFLLAGVRAAMPRPNLSRVFEYAREGLPTVPLTLGIAGLSAIDRFAITSRIGLAETGAYAFAAMLANGIWLLAFAFQQAWAPWLYGVLKEPTADRLDEARRAALLFAGIVVFLGAAVIGGTIILAPHFLGPEYAALPLLIVPLATAAVLSSLRLLFESGYYYFKQTWWLSAFALAGLALSAVGILVVIGPYGAIGVAWVMAGSNAAILAATAIFGSRELSAHLRQATGSAA